MSLANLLKKLKQKYDKKKFTWNKKDVVIIKKPDK